jgi:hypothetical protein
VKGKAGGINEGIVHAKRAVYDVYEVEYLYVRTKFRIGRALIVMDSGFTQRWSLIFIND